jgi:hypothetical protein
VEAVGGVAEPSSSVGHVVGVGPWEPLDVRVALEGQNVGCDAVEEPTVTAL